VGPNPTQSAINFTSTNKFLHDLNRARPFEQLIVDLLNSWGISAGLNPHHDQRLADYDVWLFSPDSGYWLECKADWKSKETGNICVELEALGHSRAFLFVYGLPYGTRKVYIHAFAESDLRDLTKRTKLTHNGRLWAYRHIAVGDQIDNEAVLIPREIVKTVGLPFGRAIRELTNNAHVQMHANN
jgi:hypothetical protein